MSFSSGLGHPDGVDDDEVRLARRVGRHRAVGGVGDVRTPRPFICSKNVLDFTLRMKKTHSSGLMSVPVAIMSTVTTMRGFVWLRNAASKSSGFASVVR